MIIYLDKYKEEYRLQVEDMINNDSFVQKDILSVIDMYPNHTLVVFDNDELIAIGAFTGIDDITSITLYVKEEKRGQGIGTSLLSALEEKMKEQNIQEVVCDFLIDDKVQGFLNRRGYDKWFESSLMKYQGNKIAVDERAIEKYKDTDYFTCQRVLSTSFHELRLSVGLESSLSLPSEKQKNQYNDNADNIFVVRDKYKEIVAVAIINGNELESTAVAINKQNLGYGKPLICHCINKILERGNDAVYLWVIEGNKARIIYDKLGFKVERKHLFYKKFM